MIEKLLYSCLLLIVAVFPIMDCINQCSKKITVLQSVSHLPVIDGELASGEWDKAKKIQNFTFPWRNNKQSFTEFFVSVDSTNFNFAFLVEDRSLVWEPYKNEMDVSLGDRVEIFFAKDKDLNEYFCLEINPVGKVLDYKATYYRKFDVKWSFSELYVM